MKEYAAHLIPEGGYDAMPALAVDGLLVAGDAAGMTLAAGIWLEGVNFAIGSGLAAGRTAAAGHRFRGRERRRVWPATGRPSKPTSCCRTTSVCARAPTWSSPSACRASTRS